MHRRSNGKSLRQLGLNPRALGLDMRSLGLTLKALGNDRDEILANAAKVRERVLKALEEEKE